MQGGISRDPKTESLVFMLTQSFVVMPSRHTYYSISRIHR